MNAKTAVVGIWRAVIAATEKFRPIWNIATGPVFTPGVVAKALVKIWLASPTMAIAIIRQPTVARLIY